MPSGVRTSVCDALGLNPDDVRVLVGDVGGGFGMKTGAYPEDLALAYGARALKRPLKWRAERLEEFLSAVHGRDVVSHAEMALDQNGKVLAIRVKAVGNTGAYATGTGILIPLVIGPWVTTSIYDITVMDLQLSAVMTHTNTIGAYRGAGRPEAIYQIERLMDAAAREMKLDPAELRRRNMIRPNQFPYTNPMAQVYDCGEFEKILDQGLKLADWNGFAARRAASERKGKLRGRGIATFLEWTSGMAYEERVTVTVTPDGMIEVNSAVQAMGQGIATSLAQLAVDVFQVPIDRIRVVHGRHRPQQRLRQRRLALALHRRLGGARGVAEDDRRGEDDGRRGAGGAGGRHRIQGGPLQRDRHRPRHRPVRARRQAEGRAHLRRRQELGRRPELAQRLPRVRGGDRSRHRRTSRWWPMRRSTTSAAWSARRSRAARSKAARCRASDRRCARRCRTTRRPARR